MGRDDSSPAGSTRTGGTILPVANLMADSESGNPIFYLLAEFSEDTLIGGGDVPPELNSKQRPLEIVACDRQTDGRNITIAGRHIVAGQLIKQVKWSFVLLTVVHPFIVLSAKITLTHLNL